MESIEQASLGEGVFSLIFCLFFDLSLFLFFVSNNCRVASYPNPKNPSTAAIGAMTCAMSLASLNNLVMASFRFIPVRTPPHV